MASAKTTAAWETTDGRVIALIEITPSPGEERATVTARVPLPPEEPKHKGSPPAAPKAPGKDRPATP